jgi:predicted ester cyclase
MKKLCMLAAAVTILYSCNDQKSDSSISTSDSTNMTDMKDSDSKEERNKQTALASIDGFNKRDVDVTLKDVDNDAMEYGDGSMEPVKGRDSVRKWMEAWFAAVPDIKANNVMAAADGDHVMVYSESSGTWKNDFMGMKATGKAFKVKDVDIFKFNDAGKIIEHRAVQSNATMARQIGMPMPDPKKE